MPPMASALEEDFPEVETTVRIFDPNLFDKAILVGRGDLLFKENDILYADSTFFKAFSFHLKTGSPQQCLTKPHSVVLTESTKQKYFGEKNALGEELILNNEAYIVTGIVENTPPNSHFKFDFLASLSSLSRPGLDSWVNTPFYTYVLLRNQEDIQKIQNKLAGFAGRHANSDLEKYFNTTYANLKKSGGKYDFILQPITDIHLHSNMSSEIGPNGDYTQINILRGVALFILITASINFINLTTALSSQRAKEIGVKKIFGGTRMHLIKQFLFESILYASLSVAVGLALAFSLLPSFNYVLDQSLGLSSLITIKGVVAFSAFAIGLGVISGIYPALFMSSFTPAGILKGSIREGLKNKGLRNSLVVVQFSISIFLIVCSTMFYKQMNFMVRKDLGFNKEQVIILKNISKLGTSLPALKTELAKISEVKSTSASREIPSVEFQTLLSQPEGSDRARTFAYYLADEDYVQTFGLQVIEGRNFAPDFSADSTGAVLINESLKKELELGSPLGKSIDIRRNAPIVGVIKDFNFEALRNKVQPLAIFYQKNAKRLDFLSVRYDAKNTPEVLAKLEASWKKVAGNLPFEFEFLDQRLANQYRQEKSFYQITTAFTVISIVISSLGLIGLTTFAIKKKEKEISIRKVLGSSIAGIQVIFAKDILRLILVSSLLSIPCSIWFINHWLNEFSYRTTLDPMVFVFAIVLMCFITISAVLYFTLKAAFVNPVGALRNE